jgi:hypothetical protein
MNEPLPYAGLLPLVQPWPPRHANAPVRYLRPIVPRAAEGQDGQCVVEGSPLVLPLQPRTAPLWRRCAL